MTMARGAFSQAQELFQIHQEDAWERTAQLLAMIFNTTRTEAADCKEPDDFNLWLAVEGVELPDAETRRKQDEVIAERKAACQNNP